MYNITATDVIGMVLAGAALIALSLWAQGFHKNPRNIIGQRKTFFMISAVLLLISFGALLFKGFEKSMDFTGGTIVEIGVVKQQDQVTPERVREAVLAYSAEKGLNLLEPQVQVEERSINQAAQPFRKVIIRMAKSGKGSTASHNITTLEVQGLVESLEPKLGGELFQQAVSSEPGQGGAPAVPVAASPVPGASPVAGASPGPAASGAPAAPPAPATAQTGPTTRILSMETIDPIIGGELFVNSLLALFVALVMQLLYITFRFGNQMRYGIAADVALVHDVIIMAGLYALAGREVDSPFLAALLTVVGYSVMDSIVVFDRIRENVKNTRRGDYEAICNASLNQTMTRSVNTTLTVLLTLFALFFFGGATLRNFAFALLVGITAGAYSSIFVATPLVVMIDEWKKKRDEQKVTERRALRESQGRPASDVAAPGESRSPRPEGEARPSRPRPVAVGETDDEPAVADDDVVAGGTRGASTRSKAASARRDKTARRRR